MLKIDEPLYVKCPVCAGTKATPFDIHLSGGSKLVAGSACFACRDNHGEGEPLGFVETGMTVGQAEQRRAWVDRLKLFVEEVARFDSRQNLSDATVADALRTLKGIALELVRGHAGEIEDSRRRIKGQSATPKPS